MTHTPRKLKRLFLDIETSPNVVYTWRIGYKIQLSHDNIIHERKIICISWKWEDEKTSCCIAWDGAKDDGAMLRKILPILNEADEIVMHNGDRFDFPWIRTRCIFHKLPMWPVHKTVDTLKWAKRHFLFNSNRLDYISKYLGDAGKLKTDFALWKKVMAGDAQALEYMVKYCKVDVIRLETVYHKLASYIRPVTHTGVLEGNDKWSCPSCGSANVRRNMIRITASGVIAHQMRCGHCKRCYKIGDPAYKAFKLR